MTFTTSDFDLAVPLAMRAMLDGWRPGTARPLAELCLMESISAAQAEALVVALAAAGLVGHEGAVARRTDRAVRLLAVDLGGTKLQAALVDETGAILAERLEPTVPDVLAVIDQIARLQERLAADAGLSASAILGAAMGVPGAVDPRSGRVKFATNIAGLDATDLAAALERRLGHAVRLDNDVNFAALGESAVGVAQGIRDFAFVALGTGVGMGLVLDGRLVRGHSGMAGEIATLPVGAAGAPLEDIIGTAGILAAARQAGVTQAGTVKALFDEARAGSVAARGAIDATAQTLFTALLALRAVADPELIVLGGSIGLQPEITGRVSALAEANPFAPRIAVSALGGHAALAGASLAALAQLGPQTAQEPVAGRTGLLG